ncbi:hypothetical protein Riv7116_6421 [Rivularia sp. PCC 7116]|uniref:ARPP-1 family domain-containing protein n=1 Tax=Rivularia sp. PCC 7116 TaxID=373994 RepID=UPI00029ED4A0|nr:DUF6569 family protein [Rivularia sp. PCC 7116]AFY58757.1 hypothetical protein Riv7116_6421 [Rivularia sp. PCC 7116]
MNYHQLVPQAFDLSAYRFGIPQKSGIMTVIPIFGSNVENANKFAPPLSGLKLTQVRGYGNMEITNHSQGIAILPLHMGYIQDKAQNHALCRSAFIAQGQKLMFEDACCVQSGQGGFLEEREQWFFILPLFLREEALKLQGQKSYSKLWNAISRLNQYFGLQNRGHLEQILSRKRAFLTQYQSRFELLRGQTGALFILGDKLAGIEIAPNAAYFQEVWMSLVCFCYGVAAMYFDKDGTSQDIIPFSATNLAELRQQLIESRQQMYAEVQSNLAKTPPEQFEVTKQEKFLNLRLKTIEGNNFAGEFVEEDGNLVYASVFAKSEYALSV